MVSNVEIPDHPGQIRLFRRAYNITALLFVSVAQLCKLELPERMPMDLLDPNVLLMAQGLWDQCLEFLQSLLLPYRLWQVAIVTVLFVAAHVVDMILDPRMEVWLRSLQGMQMWQMRMLVQVRNRMRGLTFVLLAWGAVLVISQSSIYPSRRYIVVLFATLATAWVVVGLLSRLIRNRFIRRIVTWGAWIYATLAVLGFLDPAAELLNSIGVDFGGFRLSLLLLVKALAVTAAMFSLARLATQTASSRIRANADINPSMQVLAVKALQITMYTTAAYVGLKAAGFDLTGLAVLSGAIGVGLGFGLQKVVSNLVSGVIILLDESIKPGDVISLGDTFGWIEALGARYVSVVTRDGKEYLIPNEDLITGQVVNWSHSNDFVRLDLHFGTSYKDDPHVVRKLATTAAVSVPRVLNDRPAVCHIVGFGESSVDYILRFWIKDPTEGLTNIRGNVYLALWDSFKANGITLPFPQSEVRLVGGGSDKTDAGDSTFAKDHTNRPFPD